VSGVYQFKIVEGNGAIPVIFKKVEPSGQLLCTMSAQERADDVSM
jgi:hypothetical protein